MKNKKESAKRVALITGASQGIGKAIARALGEAGMEVVLCSRRRVVLESVKKEFEKAGIVAHIAVADIAKPEQVKRIFKTVIKKIGRLDVLVNNAGGIGIFGGFFDLSDIDWQAAFNVNFMSAVYCIRGALPWLKKAYHPRIITISASAGGFQSPLFCGKGRAFEFKQVSGNAFGAGWYFGKCYLPEYYYC